METFSRKGGKDNWFMGDKMSISCAIDERRLLLQCNPNFNSESAQILQRKWQNEHIPIKWIDFTPENNRGGIDRSET